MPVSTQEREITSRNTRLLFIDNEKQRAADHLFVFDLPTLRVVFSLYCLKFAIICSLQLIQISFKKTKLNYKAIINALTNTMAFSKLIYDVDNHENW